MTFLRRTFSHLPFFLFLFYMWRVDDMQTDLNMPSSRMMMTPRCLAVSRGKTNIWHDIQPLRITSSGRPTAGWQAESCRWTSPPSEDDLQRTLRFHFVELCVVLISRGLVPDCFVDGESQNWILFLTLKTLQDLFFLIYLNDCNRVLIPGFYDEAQRGSWWLVNLFGSS